MTIRLSSVLLVSAMTISVLTSSSAVAQGLIFNLPADRTGVQYEGTVTQTYIREDIEAGKEVILKNREMTIKSVGMEDAEFEGQVQPCRWIEIKIATGTAGEAGIDPGPVGSRIYKVLVPESKVMAEATDADSIPNIVLPIVKGYRRNGEAAIHKIKTAGLGTYPTICQLINYPEPTVVAAAESPQTKANNVSFSAKHMKGRLVMERPESRSTNEADFWVTPEVPFGLARWEVVVTQERKESTAPRDSFREISTTKSQMSYVRTIEGAESEMVIPAGL